jgi:hypothetical protein
MKEDIKEISSTDFYSWANEHTKVDIEKKYITKLEEYLSQWGFKPTEGDEKVGRWGIVSLNGKYIFDLSSRAKKVSIEVHQFDDDWFNLSYWRNFSTNDEEVTRYICDQFDAVLYQLDICMVDLPKVNDTKWNDDIKNRKKLKKQKEEVLDKIRKKIMGFTDFNNLNDFRKLNNI